MNSLYRLILVLLVFFAVFGHFPLSSQTDFAMGEELFMQNKPDEALEYLERAVIEDPAHVEAFVYLAIAYQQLERSGDAIETYLKILPRAGNESARIAFNLGNVYFSGGNMQGAIQYYSESINFNPLMASAWLNRANSLVRARSLNEAAADYEQYLLLDPDSDQRPQIERIISLIREELAAEERRRIQAEAAAREEIDRRQRLLEEVTASLQAAAEDSRSLSAGVEDIQGYDGEFELE